MGFERGPGNLPLSCRGVYTFDRSRNDVRGSLGADQFDIMPLEKEGGHQGPHHWGCFADQLRSTRGRDCAGQLKWRGGGTERSDRAGELLEAI